MRSALKGIINIMVIMRSEEIRTMSKMMKDKVRRKHVNWMSELKQIGNDDLFRSFFEYKCKLYRGKSLSDRRCAYYALKNYYHTTTIDELFDKLVEVKCRFVGKGIPTYGKM